ncbi:MAG: hypothetical protein XD43_1728 [Thermococcales archaeon 44_46]|nr:MAG: hypothetical protein XD43_1728 [Thermococcales archaeon 44_46]HIH72564.1 class I SAM-dependent methyltransferase [Thermococcaceae archaeon]
MKTNIKTKDIIIQPEYSAVGSKGYPSRSIKLAINLFNHLGIESTIEVGCGLLSNTRYLLKAFKWVVLVDTEFQLKRIQDRLSQLRREYSSLYAVIPYTKFKYSKLSFESAILLNVLHVLPTKQDRIDLLRSVHSNLKNGGIVYIDSPRGERYYKKFLKSKQQYNDGWLIPRGKYATFYKDLTVNEIVSYLKKIGFNVISYPKLDHRTIVLAEKSIE